jgi:serine/threonine protein kinase
MLQCRSVGTHEPETRCPACSVLLAADARYCYGCGSALTPTATKPTDTEPGAKDASELIGREVAGRYRILSKLGEGGMGAVYRAEQISLKRKVALKVLKPELSASPGLVRRFNAEAELAAKLSHPNTVTLYDFGQDENGALFIAMEYIDGKSLRELLVQEGPQNTARIANIGAQICSSLSDAHAASIVHRDLKPDNVMLSSRGKQTDIVTVLDFGIAKLREEEGKLDVQPMTRAGDMLGTPQYMAPEQIRGDKVDARTDVYALGVILYEMATARLPFDAKTIMALLSKHLTEAPIPPRQRRRDIIIDPSLEHLILSCLAKNPDHRPPTMDVVEEELMRFVPVLASGVSRVNPEAASGASTPAEAMPSHSPLPVQQTPPNPQQGPSSLHSQAGPLASETSTPIQTGGQPARRTGLWIVLGLALLGAGGGGIYYAASQAKSAENEASEGAFTTDSTGESNSRNPLSEAASESTAPPVTSDNESEHPPAKDDVDSLAYSEGNTFVEPNIGYLVDLPNTFTLKQRKLNSAQFIGIVAGRQSSIVTTAWSVPGQLDREDIEEALDELCDLIDLRTKTRVWGGKGSNLSLEGRIVSDNKGEVGDYIFLRQGPIFYFALMGHQSGKYRTSKDFRKRFLRNHFHPGKH